MKRGDSQQLWLSAAQLALLFVVLGPQYAAALCGGLPPAVTNGVWPASCVNTSTASLCTATCHYGYYGGSPATSICQADGSWAAPVGSCFRACVSLPPTDIITGVSWAGCNNSIAPGRRCQGSCALAGLNGSPSIVCSPSATGDWDTNSVVGRCYAGTVCAGVPGRVLNGRWPTSCFDTPAGQNCTINCNFGYGPGASAACVAGAWAAPSGMCSRVCTDQPPVIPGSNITWPASCLVGNTTSGQQCVGQCPAGWTGNPRLPCWGGQWSSSVLGRCVQGNSCPSLPPSVNNAVFPISCLDTAAGDTCVATCRLGYGPGVNATCQQNGTWTAVGACHRVCPDVPSLPAVPGAVWTGCANTRVGTRCSGSCAGQNGSLSLACGGGGVWDANSLLGICTTGAVCTPPLPAVINGRWPATCFNTLSGSNCNATCNSGYGPGATVRCTGGVWEAVAGACYRVCGSVPAPSPGIPNVDWSACAGTRASWRCSGTCVGTVGSPSIVCGNGVWGNTVLGKCVIGPVCSAPFPNIINGRWPDSCLDSTVGTTCVAVCNANYRSPGANVTCTTTGWGAVTGACRSP